MSEPTVSQVLHFVASNTIVRDSIVPTGPSGKVSMRAELEGRKYKVVITRED